MSSSQNNTAETRHIYIERQMLRFTTAGSVDDGKSTLIGRLLYDSKTIFQDQIEALERTREHRGEEEINLAYLLDGLRAEREQGITIDVAYRYFSTPRRKFIIADTPGHEQYTRNMVTGASTANLAVILVDARNGMVEQSRRHIFIASLLGIPHMLIAVNKMDLVDYSEDVYNSIVGDFIDFSEKLNIHDMTFVPISALKGDNVVEHGNNMPWYDGPTVLTHLESVTIASDRNLVDFRFPVQYVNRPHQDFRGFAGRILSGTIRVGEEICVLPSRKRSKVKEIVTYDGALEEAFESQSVTLTLRDETDISRGDMIVRSHNLPMISDTLEATVCWMDDEKPLDTVTHYLLQHTTRTVKSFITKVFYKINVNTLHRESAESVALNEIARLEIKTAVPVFFDEYRKNRATGSFILIDPATNRTVAAGMIRNVTTAEQADAEGNGAVSGTGAAAPDTEDKGPVDNEETAAGGPAVSLQEKPYETVKSKNITFEYGDIQRQDREARNTHRAVCVWFTGLSGSGKSTVARGLEQRLFQEGRQVFRLDGDNVRHGLCADLGFSPEDRRNNIRRVGHAARLLYNAGQIVLCSFISPYTEDRNFVRALFPESGFIEVYVKCSVDICKARDPKGLYRKALTGEISNFTGISAPYEDPAAPELIIETDIQSETESIEAVLRELEPRL